MRENGKSIETAGLWWILIGTLVFAVPLTWMLADYAYDRSVVAARGVEADAVLTAVHTGPKGGRSFSIAVEGPAGPTATIDHVPRGTGPGDALVVRYDSEDPTRVFARDVSPLSPGIMLLGGLDLIVLPVTILCWPLALVELLRRRREGAEEVDDAVTVGDDRSRASRVVAIYRHFAHWANEMHPVRSFIVFAMFPPLLAWATSLVVVGPIVDAVEAGRSPLSVDEWPMTLVLACALIFSTFSVPAWCMAIYAKLRGRP